jgi:hypothetical protein
LSCRRVVAAKGSGDDAIVELLKREEEDGGPARAACPPRRRVPISESAIGSMTTISEASAARSLLIPERRPPSM